MRPVRQIVLPVRVPVDEPGGDDKALRVHDPLPFERGIGDRRDPAVMESNIPNRVELGLRVDDPAIDNDQI